MSLDVFRGATIAAMMLVNNPGNWGAVYPPLLHAPWHGWTFTDLVFPFFLWIVGVAIPLSVARRLEEGQSRRELFGHAARRSLILFSLGLFLNSFSYFLDGALWRDFPAWLHDYATSVRIPGVLQRIAVCYLAATAVFLVTGLRGQILATASLLMVYWALMMLVPVPGYGAGVLEKQGNLSQYLDHLILNGPVIGTHVWKSAGTWDPEGIFSTLPAIATCLFGVLTGHLLRSKLIPEAKTSWMFVAGCGLLLAGEVMDIWLPINKNLWTSSYSVFMAGMALLCFGVCYWLVDVQGWRRWAQPFAIYGMNAITVFVLAGVLGRLSLEIKVGGVGDQPLALKTWLFNTLFGWVPDPRIASLLWAVMYVLLLYAIAYGMYRRKWFVKF
jgi:predicted acyltransferase